MRNLFVLLAIGGLFFVTGCVEQPIEEAGSSTPISNLQDDNPDCCVEPNEDEPTEEPSPDVSDAEPLTVASGPDDSDGTEDGPDDSDGAESDESEGSEEPAADTTETEAAADVE
jgi:hypothetical protein